MVATADGNTITVATMTIDLQLSASEWQLNAREHGSKRVTLDGQSLGVTSTAF